MNEKLKIYGENGENQSQMNSSVTKKCFKSQRPKLLGRFFRIYFCCLLDQDRKIGQFFAGFFHISKRKLLCSLTRRKIWSLVKKMLTSSYLRTGGLNKDFVRIYIGQARALCCNVTFWKVGHTRANSNWHVWTREFSRTRFSQHFVPLCHLEEKRFRIGEDDTRMFC